jgi:dihydropteroate synthase
MTPNDRAQGCYAPMLIGGHEFNWGERTYLMGILNVTPDSFSGDGVGSDVAAAVRRVREMIAAGADIIDVGGESTRPGHTPVSAEEELARVLPVLSATVGKFDVPFSIDTRKVVVARAAVEAGASLVNDVSGLTADPDMAGTVRDAGVPVVLMARGGSRRLDVVTRVRQDLDESLARARNAGIPREHLLIDPGFGFGKNWRDNLVLLRRLSEFRSYGLPMLIGLSRKATIANILGPDSQHRTAANAALVALAIAGGADMMRVHDVGEGRDAARIADAVIRGPVDLSDGGNETVL